MIFQKMDLLLNDEFHNYNEFVCAELYGKHLSGLSTDNMLELSQMDKKRIFNLGYFTWVEQQLSLIHI